MWSGGGTNIKVLEALAHARACVTTRFCARAFGDAFDPRPTSRSPTTTMRSPAASSTCSPHRAEREDRARRGAAVVARRFGRERFDGAVRELVGRVAPAAVAA